MSCLSRVLSGVSYLLEQFGIYEPEIDTNEAKNRLQEEKRIWLRAQSDRSVFWHLMESTQGSHKSHPLIEQTIMHINSQGIQKGIAVDLGCGLNSPVFRLLEEGWKVYAVDSSKEIIETLRTTAEKWLNNGQLVLCNRKIEEFKYFEKAHVIVAIDSLPYCDPEKITEIFHEAKNHLLPDGVLACNFFPRENHTADLTRRGIFGAWLTTKNVVDAILKNSNFAKWAVTVGKSPEGSTSQFHVFAHTDGNSG